MTVSCYLILKEFDHMSACLAFNIEYCIKPPFLPVITGAFSHTDTLSFQKLDFIALSLIHYFQIGIVDYVRVHGLLK